MAQDSRAKRAPDDLIEAVDLVPEGPEFKAKVREVIRDYFRPDHPDNPSMSDSPVRPLRKKGAEKK